MNNDTVELVVGVGLLLIGYGFAFGLGITVGFLWHVRKVAKTKKRGGEL